MSINLNPYLNFNGNTKEVMEFYHKIFGGELKLSPFSDFPNPPAGYEDKIMHAALTAGNITIMASEGMPDKATKMGENVTLSLTGDHEDGEKLTSYFNQLAEKGEVTEPLRKQVWGDEFGMVTDQFGIHWMINIAQAQ